MGQHGRGQDGALGQVAIGWNHDNDFIGLRSLIFSQGEGQPNPFIPALVGMKGRRVRVSDYDCGLDVVSFGAVCFAS
jgi:hypothetical protein